VAKSRATVLTRSFMLVQGCDEVADWSVIVEVV